MENNPGNFGKEFQEMQNNIQQVENRIRCADSENKMNLQENQSKIKENDLEINKLIMEIKELQIRMERGKKADEMMAVKAFDQYSLDDRKIQGKSAKEILQQIDTEVIELEKRKKELDHELDLQKRSYRHSEEEFLKRVAEYDDDFENGPTEELCREKSRELQKQQQDVDSKILDSEVAEGVLKRMKTQFEKILSSQSRLCLNAQKESNDLQKSFDDWVLKTNNKLLESPEEKKSSLKCPEDHKLQSKDVSDKKRVQFSSEDGSVLQAYQDEQECEFQEMKEALAKIRDVTGVSDIKDVEARIIEIKSLHQDLVDLKKRTAKTLQELKSKKRQQDTRMEIFNDRNVNGPKRELEEAVKLTKRRLTEQEKRKRRAEKELQAVDDMLESTRPKLLKILKLIEKKKLEGDSFSEEISVLDLAKKVENYFQNVAKKDQATKEKGDYKK